MSGPAVMVGILQLGPEAGVVEGWSDGAGMIAIGVLLVTAALAVVCGHRVWVNDRLLDRTVAGLAGSSPRRDEFDGVDPETETRRLLALARRVTRFTIGWVPFAVAIVVLEVNYLPDPAEDRQAVVAVTVVLSLGCVVFGQVMNEVWHRRYRSVLATGWRPATVTVNLDHDRTNPEGEPRIFDVRFPGGERSRLRGVQYTSRNGHRFGWRPDIPVWVGGEGETMVLLFSRGPSVPPCAVPARLIP
ncbi:hypothetical protein [Amycolatopsis orientalis]|uniref:hypothetical protein n=1 Tax=Amycolatopsis orientalis TaxID=31958 RepID=UPI00056BC429|nr:hypothetical protein [Amycolatopsis orientalis]